MLLWAEDIRRVDGTVLQRHDRPRGARRIGGADRCGDREGRFHDARAGSAEALQLRPDQGRGIPGESGGGAAAGRRGSKLASVRAQVAAQSAAVEQRTAGAAAAMRRRKPRGGRASSRVSSLSPRPSSRVTTKGSRAGLERADRARGDDLAGQGHTGDDLARATALSRGSRARAGRRGRARFIRRATITTRRPWARKTPCAPTRYGGGCRGAWGGRTRSGGSLGGSGGAQRQLPGGLRGGTLLDK